MNLEIWQFTCDLSFSLILLESKLVFYFTIYKKLKRFETEDETKKHTSELKYLRAHIYIYIYAYNHENNVPSWLSPQWLYGNSCTWAHDLQFKPVVITRYDCTYITLILLLWDLRTLCVVNHISLLVEHSFGSLVPAICKSTSCS